MYSKLNLLIVALIVCASSINANAQCDSTVLTPVTQLEQTALVIDVRPDQINQFRGKSEFKTEAKIALVNMNPFLFSYALKVDQTEIQDTGFLNFLKLLGSPVSDLIESAGASLRNEEARANAGGSLPLLIRRTAVPPTAPHDSCPRAQFADARDAISTLSELRNLVVTTVNLGSGSGLDANVNTTAARYEPARRSFNTHKNVIFDSAVEATPLCNSANTLHGELTGARYPDVNEIQNLLIEVRNFQSLADELRESAQEYKDEYAECPARVNGLSYADNLIRLANEFTKLGTAYETKVSAMLAETRAFNALISTIAKLNTHERELLQKEYTVTSRYDISALDITATAVPLDIAPTLRDKDGVEQRVVGNSRRAQVRATSVQSNERIVSVGPTESERGVRVFASHGATLRAQADTSGSASEDEDDGDNTETGAKQIKARGTIGTRRFQVSGGMAFSSLGRREFQPVIGFPRNAQGETIDPETGNPTNNPKMTTIVGLSEDSSRRFSPIGMLHYRIPYTRDFFASVGFTGKRDDYGVDLEYLFGPSFLYKNLFLTFGGYVGKQQRLAGDLFEAAPIEGEVPVRKEYKWGFGFSLTFKIPLGDKPSQ